MTAREYRDQRTQVSMADAVEAAKQAADVAVALERERTEMHARMSDLAGRIIRDETNPGDTQRP